MNASPAGVDPHAVRAPSVESTVMPAARDRETCEDLARTNAERPTGRSAALVFVEVFFGTLFIPMVDPVPPTETARGPEYE